MRTGRPKKPLILSTEERRRLITEAGIDRTPRAQSTAARQAGPRGAGLCGRSGQSSQCEEAPLLERHGRKMARPVRTPAAFVNRGYREGAKERCR
jgi:hypothetical protein